MVQNNAKAAARAAECEAMGGDAEALAECEAAGRAALAMGPRPAPLPYDELADDGAAELAAFIARKDAARAELRARVLAGSAALAAARASSFVRVSDDWAADAWAAAELEMLRQGQL
jgi:hypothetical protein